MNLKTHLIIAFTALFTLPAFAQIDPDTIKINKRNWTYFGWAEDHPKANSLMGGALYARRPKLAKSDNHSWACSKEAWHPDSDKPLFFMLSVDGSTPFYPDEFSPSRRQDIHWHLAQGSLPFPTSCWVYKGVEMKVTHLGRRILNNTVNAVYTRVVITNTDRKSHKVSLSVVGKAVAERCFFLNKARYVAQERSLTTNVATLKPGKSQTFDFVIPANGKSSKEDIIKNGSYDANYTAEKASIEKRMSHFTMPIALPDARFIDLWKSSMTYMWHATVKTTDDYEQRGSGGNVFGFYQYDRTFDHDVPDMVIQYIIEGNLDMARQIMVGATYDRLSSGDLTREAYLDAIPKYMISFAQYLQTTGDKAFFTESVIAKLKQCSRAVHNMRVFTDEARQFGVWGLIRKGWTLDNSGGTYLIVDNFAALHGFTAYKYICSELGIPKEAEWADKELKDLNDCLNAALRKSMKHKNINWYNACLSFDMDFKLVSGPGNWLGTTFMMPSFPWNAQLKGFDLGGEWLDYLDNSVRVWQEVSKFYNAGKGLVGAWWNAKYGAAYDTAMVMQLLASDKYRTLTARSIEALLDNQSAPMNWGESFHAPESTGNWTKPETDLETWSLGFIRQAMLQMCISVKANGDAIIGRGLSNEWILSGKPIVWERVRINGGKQISLSICKVGDAIEIDIEGDKNSGNYIIDIPYCVGNISEAEVEGGKLVGCYPNLGKVVASGDATKIIIRLIR